MNSGKMKFLSYIFLLFVVLNSSIAQWLQVSNGIGNVNVQSLAVSGNNIFAAGYGVFVSSNNGDNWSQTSLNNVGIWSLAVNGNYIFAGSGITFNGIFVSTNNGVNWEQTSLNNQYVYSIAVNGNYVFAATNSYGIYRSTDNGANWSPNALNNQSVISLAVRGNNIYAGTNNGVYLSTNNGDNWTQTSFNNQIVWFLAVSGIYIYAGTQASGVFVSTDNGTNWTQTSLNNIRVWSLAAYGNSVYVGNGGSTQFYFSNDNGANWTLGSEGLPNNNLRSFCILNNYIFTGTNSFGVYRRPLSELTGIQPISNEIPMEFSLSQNYPNPFNPNTKIKFSIPLLGGVSEGRGVFVSLKVYDILGREVALLVNEQLNPGTYEVDWVASKYPSGVYYYRLESGNYTGTKKMLLIK